MRKIVNPNFLHLNDWIQQVPSLFKSGEGKILFTGRNQIRLFEIDGEELVVKRYKRHDIVKAFAYTFFRKNKACKSYENAVRLREYGFCSPQEVAYLECTFAGLIIQVYYICVYTDAKPIRPRLIEQKPFNEQLAVAYARYVASLHEAGVLHCDLNPTNVLFTEHNGNYGFELIDINRMRFYNGPVPKEECMENLTLFYWLTPVYRFILDEYAHQRGWTEVDKVEAIHVKEKHDKRWICRKKITHLGKYEVLH